ncbi:MAG: T9SS type B sorting domain-containing protein [Flavobacteriales bacterium]|nr:T9SS type B sorting domain-containing protein [Flavobacteriales bacterium]
MKKVAFILLSSFLCFAVRSQTPTTCFEIESLLVDACALGSNCDNDSDPACDCEGKNEMFRFKVGPDDLNTSDMDVEWPNGFNNWLGVCQNATTAQHVEDLNETILNCGLLLEPENGVLPSGEDVLIVGSTDMCVASNSFAGLSDTIIIIFQCQGNYFGHFANQNNGSNNLRTLEVNFGQGCEDEVTYDRSLLIDQSGLNLPQDGATVNFTWEGDDSYTNTGCNAPIEQSTFEAGEDVTLCPGASISLSAEVADEYTDFEWSGGEGTFNDINDLNTTYNPSPDDGDEFTLTLSAQGCNGLVTDEIQVQNLTNALIGISTDGGTAICEGQSLTLTAEGSGLFEWSTNVIAPSISVEDQGTYSVSVTNTCGTFTESIDVSVEPLPTVDILNPIAEEFCQGGSVELSAEGTGGVIEWSTTESGNSIEVGIEGWYYATISNDCAVVTDSTEVTLVPLPIVQIEPLGPVELCEGAEVVLTAVGVGEFLWSTTETTASITVTELGSYSVQADNQCGSDGDGVEVVFGGFLPQASIDPESELICPGDNIQLIGSGGDDYLWNGEESTAIISVMEAGVYTLTAVNECGMDEASVSILADDVPEAILNNGPDYAICNGEEAIVQVSGTGSFIWSDGAMANSNAFSSTGNFYVVAEASCGVDTAFFEVFEQEISAQAFADPVLGDAPLSVNFSNETGNSSTVEWVFELGQVSSSDNASYTFLNEGDYEVSLTATTDLGCESSTNILISVGACPFALYIPSAFTPDGDGYNDHMIVQGNCIDQFEWHIFDRWGREIYFSIDPLERWNGADISGYAVLNGDYPYWIQVQDSNGVPHRFEGTITVIR